MSAAPPPSDQDPEHADTELGVPQTQDTPYPADAAEDLTAVPGAQLRRRAEKKVIAAEENGNFYAPIFRQLQIRPDKYHSFHNGVIRVIRNKHEVEVRRGTDAGIRIVSAFLLRGFGYIVWKEGSDWLLDDSALEGEERLIYVKGEHQDPNPRFYTILETIWRQMRNIMFVKRNQPAPRKVGRPRKARPGKTRYREQEQQRLQAEEEEYDDPSYIEDDIPTPVSPHSVARATATKKVESVAAYVANRLLADTTPHQMTATETDSALLELIVRLSQIRARSDPKTFEELWFAHIMRVEEFDDAQQQQQQQEAEDEQAAAVPPQHSPDPVPSSSSHGQNRTAPSNEPFASQGNPTHHAFPSTSHIFPSLPSTMSIYISVARLPNTTSNTLTSAAPSVENAYHWPSAPVENHSFPSFFEGVNLRTNVDSASILG